MSLHLPSDTPHHDFPKAGRPLLRNAWSASTLLGGVTALDIQAVKRELPDDPAELRKYYEAVHVVRQKYLHLGPPCLKLIMTFCQMALKTIVPQSNFKQCYYCCKLRKFEDRPAKLIATS